MTLGEIIQTKRGERGLSQETLAEQVGVSRQAVSKWELGDAIPDTDKLVPLARTLGITVDELLGYAPEGEKTPPVTVVVQKEPGWWATHWYWLGLIPAIWGAFQLLYLLVMILSFAGFVSVPVTAGTEIVASGGAFPMG